MEIIIIIAFRLIMVTTGVGSGGYAGDLTPPTIYVEGILISIPLEKPNT